MNLRRTYAVFVFVAVASFAEIAHASPPFDWMRVFGREPYALDAVPRYLEDGQLLDCPDDELVSYRGDVIRYRGALRVHGVFVDRLRRFEQVVRDTAVEIYGRAPRRIRHAGTYNCRLVRGRRRRISEHALGNALDLKGFDFGPLARAEWEGAPEGLPRSLKRAFRVSIAPHWKGGGRNGETHQAFLHELGERLDRGRIFRGMIGPSHPRHHNHLHLDAGPYRFNWL